MTVEARSLRGFPLLDVRDENVSDRAYFLWQSGAPGDHLSHWLEAEAEEIVEQAEQGLVLPVNCDRFLRDYSLVNHIRFVTREPQTQRYIGARCPRACTLCQNPKATFRSDAHVLPALTGSRWLLTYDECDQCNSLYGGLLDDELGKMLLPARAFGRIPARKGPSAKMKLRSTGGSVGGQGANKPLAMQIHAEDDSLTYKHIDCNTVQVTAKGMPYYPIRALRSLARVMWHLLGIEGRERHWKLRDWIRGVNDVLPITYYSGFVPGAGLRHTTFALWQANDAEDLVCLFALANTFLILNTPNWTSGKQREFPLPPLPRVDELPSVNQVTLNTNSRNDSPVTTFIIRHESRRVTWSGDPRSVTCTIASPLRHAEFRSACRVETTPNGCLKYYFEGGDIMGRLVATLGPSTVSSGADEGEKVCFEYDLSAGPTEGDIPKTIDLVLGLCEGGRLVVKLDGPDWFILNAESQRTTRSPDPEVLRQWLEERRARDTTPSNVGSLSDQND